MISALFISWLAYTSSGLQLLITLAPKFAPGELHIQSAQGKLSQAVELNHIDYRDNDISFHIDKIKLNWQFGQLFKKTVNIDDLEISNIFIQQRFTKQSNSSFTIPDWLPKVWDIHHVAIDNIIWNNHHISDIQLHGYFSMINQQIQLRQFQFISGNNTITADLILNHYWQGQWKIKLADLSQLLPDASGTMTTSGYLNGTANGNIKWQLQRLRYNDFKIDNLSGILIGNLTNHYLTVQATQGKNSLQLRLQGQWRNSNWFGKIQQLDFIQPDIGQWRLQSTAQCQITKDAIFAKNFSWQNAAGNFTLQGEWHKNQGWWLTQQGQLAIKPLNIMLKNISLSAKANNQQQLTLQGKLQSGNGTLQFSGNTNLQNPTASCNLQLHGNNFLAINTNQYQVYASPNLKIQSQNNRWQLSGTLLIPQANINMPDFKQNTVELSKDVVIIDQPKEPENIFSRHFYSDVNLLLGNKIIIHAEGLSANLTGHVTLHDTPTQLTTGNGVLIISHGQYQMYGQKLQINDGHLIFNNNDVTNPNLQIRATKNITVANVNNTTNPASLSNMPSAGAQSAAPVITPSFNPSLNLIVGVNVGGTVQDPQLSLFSTPISLSQTDILSYLLFGHPADQISAADASVLLSAASGINLGPSQLESLTRELQTVSGLDKISVESSNYVNPSTATVKQNTSLVLGKALSPKLYISYSVGLLEAVNIFTAKYAITDDWSLQSTNNSFASGVDLFYSIEH